jgi:TonB family protein
VKRIALAIVLSAAVHAVLWFTLKDAFFAPKKVPATSPVEFTIENPSPDLGRGSREAGGEGRTLAKPVQPKVQTNTPVVQNRATTESSSVIEVEIEGASDVGGPHPDPLPQAGEGAPSGSAIQKVDDAALVHARLAEAARRCYPAAARRFRQHGTVTVSFCADSSGGVIDAAVKESSGAQLLDDSALHCVLATAAPFPPEAASHCYAVPVRFDAQ